MAEKNKKYKGYLSVIESVLTIVSAIVVIITATTPSETNYVFVEHSNSEIYCFEIDY